MLECTFCSNTAIAEYTVEYSRSGTFHHCKACAIEYGVTETHSQLIQMDLLTPVDN